MVVSYPSLIFLLARTVACVPVTQCSLLGIQECDARLRWGKRAWVLLSMLMEFVSSMPSKWSSVGLSTSSNPILWRTNRKDEDIFTNSGDLFLSSWCDMKRFNQFHFSGSLFLSCNNLEICKNLEIKWDSIWTPSADLMLHNSKHSSSCWDFLMQSSLHRLNPHLHSSHLVPEKIIHPTNYLDSLLNCGVR